MSADQEMWTPLESAFSPFKELARLNRQTVTGADGHANQLVLESGRCRVHPGQAGAEPEDLSIEIGFAWGGEAYAVRLVGSDYRRDGRWDFERIRTDISAGLQSGALRPGVSFVLAPNA